MKSMTGYGFGQYKCDDYALEIELKSYNNRYLEIFHNINPLLSSYENYVDEEIKKIAKRGHVDFSMRLKVLQSRTTLSYDEVLLEEYKRVFEDISKQTGLKPSFSDYANLEGLIVSSSFQDQEFYKLGVESALKDALAQFEASKLSDGKGTEEDLIRLGKNFEEAVNYVESKSGELEEFLKNTLFQKYEELTGEKGKDDPRFMTEVATSLVKYSINEEMSRLKTHIKEYFRLLSLEEPVGKQLDFLCQEMNRECNTTASKSQLAEINLQVVKMKDNLENIREQIRNIE